MFMYNQLTMGLYRKKTDMTGKMIVITGGNAGIGLETARGLVERGATVVMGCRSRERGNVAVVDIKLTTGEQNIKFLPLDLLSLESVREFAKEIGNHVDKIDILINNAGMADGRKDRNFARSKDNIEVVTQTNHLSHFLLTNLLKNLLAAAGNARVINVSSAANKMGKVELDNINYEKSECADTYPNSKLMNIMFSKELTARWKNIGVTSYSLHPGFVRTNIFDTVNPSLKACIIFFGFILGKNNLQGAQTSLYLSCEPDIEHLAGEFFRDCKVESSWLNKQALDKDVCAGLWKRSEQLVGTMN